MVRALLLSAAFLTGALTLSAPGLAGQLRPEQNPTPATQYPTPSFAPPTNHASHVSGDIRVQAVHNYGACIVANTPQGAREALTMDFRGADYKRKIRALAQGHSDGRCMLNFSRLAANQTLLAGAMAEALIKTDVREADLPRRLAYDPARQLIQARSPLEEMALCAVMKAPDATLRLFGTKPATSEEQAAMKPITGLLSDCLKKDVKLTIDGPAIRSLLALAAWRIATTPQMAAR